MNAGLLLFQTAARGPSQLKSTLRQAIRAVASSIQEARCMRVLRSSIPDELLGTGLLEVLSLDLRRLIESPDPQANTNAAGHSQRETMWQSPVNTGASSAAFTAPLSGQKDSSGWQSHAFGNVEHRRRPQADAKAQHKTGQDSTFSEPAEPSVIGRSVFQKNEEIPKTIHRLSYVDTGESKRAGNTDASLSSALKRYYEIAQLINPASKPNVEVPQAPSTAKTVVSKSPIPADKSSIGPWPDIAGTDAARRISRLVEQAPSQISSSRVKNTVRLQQPDRIDIRNVFQIQVHGNTNDRDVLQRDLAQNLADLLREQAAEYGIDDV